MNTVKYMADIETPTDYTGYLVDDYMYVPLDQDNRHYKMVQDWISEGNTPQPAYTQDELDAYAKAKANEAMQDALEAILVTHEGHTYSGSAANTTQMEKAYSMARISGNDVPVMDEAGEFVYLSETDLATVSQLMMVEYNKILTKGN